MKLEVQKDSSYSKKRPLELTFEKTLTLDTDSFICKFSTDECFKIKAKFEEGVPSAILSSLSRFSLEAAVEHHHASLFDEPTSARMVLGWLQWVNRFNQDPAGALLTINLDDAQGLNIFFNCATDTIKNAVSRKPVAPKIATLSSEQNTLEWLYPYDINIDLEEFLEVYIKENYAEIYEKIDNYGIRLKGQARVTKDLEALSSLDYSKLKPTGIFNTTSFATRNGHSMDKISLRQNMFIEIQDKKAGSDLTILPFSI